MAILEASAANVHLIAPLFEAYRAFYGQKPSADEARRFLEQRLEQRESVVFYAADGDDVVGFVQLYPLFSSIGMRRIWLLNDLFVVPSHRRLGYGKELLDRARQFAGQTDAAALFLQTGVRNIPAQALYESQGYVRDELFYRYDLALKTV